MLQQQNNPTDRENTDDKSAAQSKNKTDRNAVTFQNKTENLINTESIKIHFEGI